MRDEQGGLGEGVGWQPQLLGSWRVALGRARPHASPPPRALGALDPLDTRLPAALLRILVRPTC